MIIYLILNKIFHTQILDFEYYVETPHEKQLCMFDIVSSDMINPHPDLLHDLPKLAYERFVQTRSTWVIYADNPLLLHNHEA